MGSSDGVEVFMMASTSSSGIYNMQSLIKPGVLVLNADKGV